MRFLLVIYLFIASQVVQADELEQLERVPVSAPQYLQVLTKIQQVLYKKQNWDKFFAYALYYRSQYLNSKGDFKLHWREEIVSLELFALAKLCHWDAVKSLVEKLKMKVSQYGLESEIQFQKIATQAQLLLDYRYSTASSPSIQKKSQELQLWPIPDNFISKISHPKNLRLKVENKCD